MGLSQLFLYSFGRLTLRIVVSMTCWDLKRADSTNFEFVSSATIAGSNSSI